MVYPPFFSKAMGKWRIEFLGAPTPDSRYYRQSSIYTDDHSDALAIHAVVKDITVWSAWIASGENIRAAMLNGSGQVVYRSGIPGVAGEIFHRDTA